MRLHNVSLLIVLAPAMFAACTPLATHDNGTSTWSNLPVATTRVVNTEIDGAVRAYAPIGYSIAVMRRGNLVYSTYGGVANLEFNVPMPDNAVFPIYSISKLFFNVAFLQLIEDGRVNPKLPLGAYLDGLPEAWRGITVHQAWSHVSGLPDVVSPDGSAPATQQEALDSVHDKPFVFPTGSASQYNQTNFLLLKMILEKIVGEPYVQYVTRTQIEALGLKHTFFDQPYNWAADKVSTYRASTPGTPLMRLIVKIPSYLYLAGAMNATRQDLVTWWQAVLAGRFVKPETLQAHWRPMTHTDGSPAAFTDGWAVRSHNGFIRVGHDGAGIICLFHYFPEHDPANSVTVIILSNGGRTEMNHHRLADLIADDLLPGVQTKEDRLTEAMVRRLATGDWDGAVRLYRRYFDGADAGDDVRIAFLSSMSYEAYSWLGLKAALPVYQFAIDEFPHSAIPLRNMGYWHLTAGDLKDARAFFRRALEITPDDQQISGALASVEARLRGTP